MIDTVFRLVDRCIELVKRRQETDKATYCNFVTPAIQDLELVHRDYLASFKKYRKMIAGTTGSFESKHPVIDAIQSDALFSGDLRSKLYALHPLMNDPVVGQLIAAIEKYLKGAANDPIGHWTEADGSYCGISIRGNNNYIRTASGNGLEALFESWDDDQGKQKRALQLLDTNVGRLQERYGAVMREHLSLKQRLLTETRP